MSRLEIGRIISAFKVPWGNNNTLSVRCPRSNGGTTFKKSANLIYRIRDAECHECGNATEFPQSEVTITTPNNGIFQSNFTWMLQCRPAIEMDDNYPRKEDEPTPLVEMDLVACNYPARSGTRKILLMSNDLWGFQGDFSDDLTVFINGNNGKHFMDEGALCYRPPLRYTNRPGERSNRIANALASGDPKAFLGGIAESLMITDRASLKPFKRLHFALTKWVEEMENKK